MRVTAIIVNDYPKDRRTQIVFTDEDFAVVEDGWEASDRLLADLQTTEPFVGYARWCDLHPMHWRILILRNLVRVAALDDAARSDLDNPAVKSLNLLIAGFILCLQERSESKIELMHINRVGDTEVVYDFTASLNLAIDIQRPGSGLRVVIDNS